MQLLIDKLTELRPFPAIVYVTLQETSETVAAHLQRAGIRARAYHAGLNDDVRSEVQQAFMADSIQVIVATIAFGMGVDKANVRAVFHFNLPKTLENYQQEIGRAGRDGQPSHCEILACGDDIRVLENFILGDTPTRYTLLQLSDHFMRQGQEFSISRYELSRSHDVKTIVLETALTYLEKAKLLEPIGSFHTKFEITFAHGEERALSGHSVGRQRFLQKLLGCGARRGRKLTITIEEAIKALDEPREKILRNLKLLEEAGDIVLLPKGIRHLYRLLPEASTHTPASLADWLHPLFAEREIADLNRLKSIVALAESTQCLTARLLRHFGEKISPCGHCSNCLSPHPRRKLPQTRPKPITLEQLALLRDLIEEKHPALRSSRQLAKFLCGLQSPALQRDRLTRHDHFAMMAQLPFSDVLAQTESMLID
jgi:ATP-dependent DNA helicase RecQ